MKRSLPYLILGCLFTGHAAWGTWELYTQKTNLTTNDLEYFSAPLEQVKEVKVHKRPPHLQLWLKGQPLTFRGDHYPKAYNSSVLASLSPGVIVRVGCRKDIPNPVYDRHTDRDHYYISSLDINNQPALRLEDFNKDRKSVV